MSRITFTPEEAQDMVRVKQDILLFLRMAHIRIDNMPDHLPFKPAQGRMVINWLNYLADLYGRGEDIRGEEEAAKQ